MTRLHDPDRLALDLLDARLEALSDGARFPFPLRAPAGAGELVHRTLERLHRPFAPPPAVDWPGLVYPLEAEAAHGALAVMTEEWQSIGAY
ncbi:hypothetical protein ADK75_27445 [Streptomyces virginiae]|uniref:Uncharacterized protein n=1 Tax=Streptomyces virginiae TaxID=1961 RepID=A0A0L8M788_STRVG|nr:hypothetical protein [Streptomyces virginiae]KOG46312.1 hypothetical protein ADK75_27445 [Streptomyces virginiae]